MLFFFFVIWVLWHEKQLQISELNERKIKKEKKNPPFAYTPKRKKTIKMAWLDKEMKNVKSTVLIQLLHNKLFTSK